MTVAQYQQLSGTSRRNRVVAVDNALQTYHANMVVDGVDEDALPAPTLTPAQAAHKEQELDALLVAVDAYLALPDLSKKRRAGTAKLRSLLLQERTQAIKVHHGPAPVPIAVTNAPALPFPSTAAFVAWLQAEAEYRRWVGQGAGQCAPATQAMLGLLTAGGIPNAQVRGILIYMPAPFQTMNHFVVTVPINGTTMVIDPTQVQFVGGSPQVADDAQRRARFQALRFGVSHIHGAHERWAIKPPRHILYQDHPTWAAANAFANTGTAYGAALGGSTVLV